MIYSREGRRSSLSLSLSPRTPTRVSASTARCTSRTTRGARVRRGSCGRTTSRTQSAGCDILRNVFCTKQPLYQTKMYSIVRRAFVCLLPIRRARKSTLVIASGATRSLTRPKRFVGLRVATPSLDEYEDVTQVTPTDVLGLVLPSGAVQIHPSSPTSFAPLPPPVRYLKSPHPGRVTLARIAERGGSHK